MLWFEHFFWLKFHSINFLSYSVSSFYLFVALTKVPAICNLVVNLNILGLMYIKLMKKFKRNSIFVKTGSSLNILPVTSYWQLGRKLCGWMFHTRDLTQTQTLTLGYPTSSSPDLRLDIFCGSMELSEDRGGGSGCGTGGPLSHRSNFRIKRNTWEG